jgi:hypothetical protein
VSACMRCGNSTELKTFCADCRRESEKASREAEERDARKRCFAMCKEGDFLDPENGCVSTCVSAAECVGWRALI